jgi:hypothetical protein
MSDIVGTHREPSAVNLDAESVAIDVPDASLPTLAG